MRGWKGIVISSALLACACKTPISAPQRPFPQHVDYAPHTLKPSRPQAELDASVKRFYDFWKHRYLFEVQGSKPVQKFVFYTRDIANPMDFHLEGIPDSFAVTASEAQGYGLVVLALMAGHDPNAKADFDAIYRFCKAHPSITDPHLTKAQQYVVESGFEAHFANFDPAKETPEGLRRKSDHLATMNFSHVRDVVNEDKDSQTDGDLDIAYGLLLADNQWGSSGAIHYREEALAVLHSIQTKLVREGALVPCAWARNGAAHPMAMKSSDLMLDHFRVFARVDPANQQVWSGLQRDLERTYREFVEIHSSRTGLLPDFLVKTSEGWMPAAANAIEGSADGTYNYNACRIPWRLSADCVLNGSDALKPQLGVMNAWIQKTSEGRVRRLNSGRAFIQAGYTLSGERLRVEDADDLAFAAPFLVNAMIPSSNQVWLDTLWDAIAVNDETHPTRPGYVNFANLQGDYYGHSLALQAQIIASGNWWQPK